MQRAFAMNNLAGIYNTNRQAGWPMRIPSPKSRTELSCRNASPCDSDRHCRLDLICRTSLHDIDADRRGASLGQLRGSTLRDCCEEINYA